MAETLGKPHKKKLSNLLLIFAVNFAYCICPQRTKGGTQVKHLAKLIALLFLVSSATAQEPAGTPLAITGLTLSDGNVRLSWADYGEDTTITGLHVYAKESLLPGVPWQSVTNMEKTARGVALPVNGAPSRFFSLFANMVKKVMVGFNANEGTPSAIPNQEVTVGEPYGPLPEVTRSGGFRFDGWFTEGDDAYSVTAATTVTETTDHFLLAHWFPYEVTWMPTTLSVTVTNDVANTFAVHAATGTDVTFTYAATGAPAGITFAPATREVTVAQGMAAGTYNFSISATPSNGRGALSLSVTVIVKHKLTVTFAPGIGTASFTSKDVILGEPYGTLPTASDATYTFAGWWTDATAGTQVQPTTSVTTSTSHTLYARWAYLGAPSNITFVNSSSATATIPTLFVSPAGASLTASSYNALAYKSGVSGNALPSGTGTSGAAWAMTYNAATRQITIPAGTSVGRYQLYGTVQVTGTSPALNLTSPSFTIEVREKQTYWCNEMEPNNATMQWMNPQNMFKTSEADTPFAYADLPNLFYREKAMYPQRASIGIEQPSYVIPVATSVDIRAWRSRRTENSNNLLHAYVQVFPTWERTTVMNSNATNPNANTWTTISCETVLIPRNGTGRIGFNAHNDNAGGTNFRVAWARFNITWAPPASGITY